MISYRSKGFDDLTTDAQRYKEQVEGLTAHRVYVGALNPVGNKSVDFLQMICSVQNFGCTIKPVNGRYLTIPTPNAHKQTAKQIGRYSQANPQGLFFHLSKSSGRPTLARNLNGQLQVVFLLATEVNIPARAFINKTMDDCSEKLAMIVQNDLYGYWDGTKHYTETLNHIGHLLKIHMQANITAWSNPANAAITAANKGKNNPLVDTGDLAKSISWVIEP